MLLHPSVSVGLDASGEDLLLKKHCGAALLWKLKDLVRHAEHRASRSGVFTDLSENCCVFQSGLKAGGGISLAGAAIGALLNLFAAWSPTDL